jgi:hypothetical protein
MRPTRPRTQPVATFLVERYWPGVTLGAFTAAAGRVRDNEDRLRREGAAIRSVAATLVPSDDAVYWIVDAASADLIETAWERAGVGLDRIVAAIELRPARELRAVGPGRREGDTAGSEGDARTAPSSGRLNTR